VVIPRRYFIALLAFRVRKKCLIGYHLVDIYSVFRNYSTTKSIKCDGSARLSCSMIGRR